MSTAEAAAACNGLLDRGLNRFDRSPCGLRLERHELVTLIRRGLVTFRSADPKPEPPPPRKPRRKAR